MPAAGEEARRGSRRVHGRAAGRRDRAGLSTSRPLLEISFSRNLAPLRHFQWTCIPMKTYLISALLLTVISSSAFGSDRKLREWLDSGSWSQGVEYCNRQLFTDLSRRPDRLRTSAEYLSRLATYCAALAGGKGDEFSSGWWWYTAASLDLKAAESLLPDLRKLGLLQALPAPRSRVSSEVREAKKEAEVQLLSGEIVPGAPPRLVIQPRPPDYLFRLARGVGRTKVTIVLVVTRDG